jgi:hypothetical protein
MDPNVSVLTEKVQDSFIVWSAKKVGSMDAGLHMMQASNKISRSDGKRKTNPLH